MFWDVFRPTFASKFALPIIYLNLWKSMSLRTQIDVKVCKSKYIHEKWAIWIEEHKAMLWAITKPNLKLQTNSILYYFVIMISRWMWNLIKQIAHILNPPVKRPVHVASVNAYSGTFTRLEEKLNNSQSLSISHINCHIFFFRDWSGQPRTLRLLLISIQLKIYVYHHWNWMRLFDELPGNSLKLKY